MPEEKPGTTQADPQDDATEREDTAADGTPEEDGPVRPKGETDYKALHHANQQTIADLKAKIDQLEDRTHAGSQPAPGRETRLQEQIDDDAKEIAELQRLAPVDAASRGLLRQRQEIQALRRDTMDALTLARVPDEKQGAVLKFYEQNRQHFDSLAGALRYLRGREAESEAGKLRTKVEELERKLKGEDKDTDVVRQGGRDLPAPKGKATPITKSDFDERVKAMKDAGDFTGARNEMDRLRKGELVLRG